MIVCPACNIPHHAECWRENGGCTTYGCSPVLLSGRQESVTRPTLRNYIPPPARSGLPGGPIIVAALTLIYVLITAMSIYSEAHPTVPAETSYSLNWHNESYAYEDEDNASYAEDDYESDVDEDDADYSDDLTSTDEYADDESDLDEPEDIWDDEGEDDEWDY